MLGSALVAGQQKPFRHVRIAYNFVLAKLYAVDVFNQNVMSSATYKGIVHLTTKKSSTQITILITVFA